MKLSESATGVELDELGTSAVDDSSYIGNCAMEAVRCGHNMKLWGCFTSHRCLTNVRTWKECHKNTMREALGLLITIFRVPLFVRSYMRD